MGRGAKQAQLLIFLTKADGKILAYKSCMIFGIREATLAMKVLLNLNY